MLLGRSEHYLAYVKELSKLKISGLSSKEDIIIAIYSSEIQKHLVYFQMVVGGLLGIFGVFLASLLSKQLEPLEHWSHAILSILIIIAIISFGLIARHLTIKMLEARVNFLQLLYRILGEGI